MFGSVSFAENDTILVTVTAGDDDDGAMVEAVADDSPPLCPRVPPTVSLRHLQYQAVAMFNINNDI